MAVQATCSCGATQSVPDAWAGREFRCSTCGGRFRVPGTASSNLTMGPKVDLHRPQMKPPGRVSRPLVTVVGVLVLLAVLGNGARMAVRARRSREYQPTRQETAGERYRSAQEVFGAGSGEAVDPQGDDARVRETLERAVAAWSRGDGDGFTSQLHFRRMIAEIEGAGASLGIHTQDEEDAFITGMRKGMGNTVRSQVGSPLQWKGVRVVKVRFVPERGEAVAYAFVRIAGAKSKFRFWLIKERQAWKIFDYESLEDGIRITTFTGSLLAKGVRDAERTIKSAQGGVAAIQGASRQIAAGDLEGAIKTLRSARNSSGPTELQTQLDSIEGVLLNRLGRHEEALQALERALARSKEHPVALQARAAALLALARPGEALLDAREVVRMVGDDPESYSIAGQALEALHQADQAVAEYRKGVACDDEEWECRWHLAPLLLGKGDLEGATKLYVEACRRAPAEENCFTMASASLRSAEAWDPLLELARDHVRRGVVRGHYYEGQALRGLGRFADAELALRTGMEKDEESWGHSYRQELLYVLAGRGKDQEAMAIVDQMEKETPDAVRVRYHRAYVHASAKRDAEALKILLPLLQEAAFYHEDVSKKAAFESVRKDPRLAEAIGLAKETSDFETRVEELEEKEDWKGLLDSSERRSRARPESWDGWYYAGAALRNLGRQADAEKPLRAAIEKSPEGRRRGAEDQLARVLAELGRTDEALALVDRLGPDPKRKGEALPLKAYVLATGKRDDEAARAIVELLGTHAGYWSLLENEAAYESVRKRPEVQEALKKAKGAGKE